MSEGKQTLPTRIGVIGGTSQVGSVVLEQLLARDISVFASSRREDLPERRGLVWFHPESPPAATSAIRHWLSLAPAYALPDYLPKLSEAGACKLVLLSSTSLLTKKNSSRPEDQALALALQNAEQAARRWGEQTGAACCVLRPTLIYGYGRDKNVAEIARIIRRFGFFPLLGPALGLRQPVHVDDVAAATLAALADDHVAGETITLSGGDILTYRAMVERIFSALGRRPVLPVVPQAAFRLALPFMRQLPRYRTWTVEMAERMNTDQVFDNSQAEATLGVSFRGFHPKDEDVSV